MTDDRLDGWDRIAKYIHRDARTAQRLEKQQGLPVRRYPGGVKSRVFAYRSKLDAWLHRGETAGVQIQDDLVATPAGPFERRLLFSYPGGEASAIRLWGAGAAYVSHDRLFVEYEHKPYVIPQELQKDAGERVARLEADTRNLNKIFFNGPCVRVMRWHHNQMEPDERDTIRLVLGPVGWYDYEGTNGLIHEKGLQADAFEKYVDLEMIQRGNFEQGCRLSNIVSNSITIFTCDGRIGYQMRGHRQSAVPGLLSSAVNENVNRFNDDVDKKDVYRHLNSTRYVESRSGPDNSYRPKGVPHPLAAIRRGIAYEWSPRLLEVIGPSGIKATGFAFGLDLLHADILWIALANITAEKIAKMRCEHSGVEAEEGRVNFVPASFGSKSTQELLSQPNWFASGKASLIRAIELIANYKSHARPEDVFDILAEAH